MADPFALPSNVHPVELPAVTDATMYISTTGAFVISRAGAFLISRAGANVVSRNPVASNPHVTVFAMPTNINIVELP